jgi:Tfp pilus assembly protein PilX
MAIWQIILVVVLVIALVGLFMARANEQKQRK